MPPIIEGISVRMDGTDYVVPPLTLKSLRKIGQTRLGELAGLGRALPSDSQFALIAEIVLLALRRNYPDLTADKVEDLLDTGNIGDVLGAVMSSSGLERRVLGEADRPEN